MDPSARVDTTMDPQHTPARRLSRRAFVAQGTLYLAAASTGSFAATEKAGDKPSVRVGLLTDLHHAEKDRAGSRYYREAIPKLREAVAALGQQKIDLAIELGDIIDAADTLEKEIHHLKSIEAEYAKLKCPRHYVMGNHCLHTLTKDEFRKHTGAGKSHYGFDAGGIRFLILDACFNKKMEPYQRKNFKWNDANIPPDQIAWLGQELKAAKGKVLVFVHQRLDLKPAEPHTINQCVEIRNLLSKSGKVLAVFQGHNHKNDHKTIDNVHYITLRAMIEGTGEANNGYGILEVMGDGSIRLQGYRKQAEYKLPK
jgi:hypothetical protein